jgi:hypothetical protein
MNEAIKTSRQMVRYLMSSGMNHLKPNCSDSARNGSSLAAWALCGVHRKNQAGVLKIEIGDRYRAWRVALLL